MADIQFYRIVDFAIKKRELDLIQENKKARELELANKAFLDAAQKASVLKIIVLKAYAEAEKQSNDKNQDINHFASLFIRELSSRLDYSEKPAYKSPQQISAMLELKKVNRNSDIFLYSSVIIYGALFAAGLVLGIIINPFFFFLILGSVLLVAPVLLFARILDSKIHTLVTIIDTVVDDPLESNPDRDEKEPLPNNDQSANTGHSIRFGLYENLKNNSSGPIEPANQNDVSNDESGYFPLN